MGKQHHQQMSLAPAQLHTTAIHVLIVLLNTHDIQLQAFFLVADDIMDNSVTRRGQPCWYRMPEVYLSRMRSFLVICCSVSSLQAAMSLLLSLLSAPPCLCVSPVHLPGAEADQVIIAIVADCFAHVTNILSGSACICRHALQCTMLLQVGTVAINDGIILESCMYRILKNHFRSTPYYVELLDLFHEVSCSSRPCKSLRNLHGLHMQHLNCQCAARLCIHVCGHNHTQAGKLQV